MHRRGFRPAAVEPGPGCRIERRGPPHRRRPADGRCVAAQRRCRPQGGTVVGRRERGTSWPYRASSRPARPGRPGRPDEAAHMIDRRHFLATDRHPRADRAGRGRRPRPGGGGGLQPLGGARAGARARRRAVRAARAAAGSAAEPRRAGFRRDQLPRRAPAVRRPADRLRRRPDPLRLHLRHPGADLRGRGRGRPPHRLRPGALRLRHGAAARGRRADRLRRASAA